jgi:hypothetical protein
MNCKVLCLVYYCSVGPYITFIFLIGYFPDILKITVIQPMFKKHAAFYGVCYLLCSEYSKALTSLIVEGMLQNSFQKSTLK